MKKNILTILILSLAIPLQARADFTYADNFDYTGEAYFEAPNPYGFSSEDKIKSGGAHETIPPIKLLRLNIQNKKYEHFMKNIEYAPTAQEPDIYASDKGISKYASKEITDDFEEMSPDGFDADEETLTESNQKKTSDNKKNKKEDLDNDKESIILDCDNVDYDTQNYLIKANGNVNIEFVKQGTTVKADLLTFDRINNTIKAEGNVRIIKNNRVVTGDYIFVDLNEENALIENPLATSDSIEIRSKKGYVYGDKIVQQQGEINVTDSYPINFRSGGRGPRYSSMMMPEEDSLTQNIENGVIKMRADSIKIKQKGDLEVISIKKGNISKGNHTIFKIPAVKIYTNKNHDYAESNFWEVGYYRGLGLYTGPGWVFELPKGSVLKAVPFINYYSGAGVGALGRFSSGTNQTTAAYGSAAKRFFVYGKQELDDDLFLQYSVNSYMDEWFLGRRRPKYGVSLVYKKDYSSTGFLLPERASSFSHRIEAGYYQDLDFDSKFEKIYDGGRIGTTRFRYMASARQSLLEYKNPEKLKSFNFDIVSNLSTALYGTGDTQTIVQLGPSASMQYKRWLQSVGYFFTAYDDNSPLVKYDSYRYGKQFLYLRESLRINKWLMLSWFGCINTTNDTLNHKRLQENAFYVTFGPDDIKFHLGYDFAREVLRANFEVMMDAKGANVQYNTFELKQDKKASKQKKVVDCKTNNNLAPTQPKVLQRAVVEDIKVMENVL